MPMNLNQVTLPSRDVPRSAAECEDLDARVAALQGVGVDFEEPPTDRPWLWREAWLRDPDGNRICLFRAGANRRNPPWRLAPGSG
jgi:hydroxymethylpyrimidine/phosphomethylpyrimidine kinase